MKVDMSCECKLYNFSVTFNKMNIMMVDSKIERTASNNKIYDIFKH